MPARIQSVLSMILAQVPTLLTLAVLGGVAWCGYYYEWKFPNLSELLGRQSKSAEEGKEPDEDKNEGPENADKPLPPVPLPSEKAAAAGIQTETIKPKMVGEYVTANGEVEFDQNRYAHLSSRASGTAWSIEKQVGDKVKKDEVLALIAAPEVARLKFDLQQTLLLVDTRATNLRRMKAGGSGIPAAQIYNAEASLREAQIRLFGDQQSLQNLGLTVRTEELAQLSDEEIAVRLRTLGIPDPLLQRLDVTKLTSNLLPLYAPFDGVVIKRDIVIGEIVNTAMPQFVLADLSHLWIMLYVHLEDAGKLEKEQEVTFRLDGSNEDAPPAKLTWISAEVDEKTHTIAARAEVPNKDGRLRPHNFGTARILVRRTEKLTVPNAALQFDGKSHLVFVRGASDAEFQPVRVQLGTRHETFTEIISGVRAGQVIATAGSHVILSEMLKKRIGGED